MSAYDYPAFFTAAELDTARGYLIACIEQNSYGAPGEPAASEIDALPAREIIARALRLWPEGWDHFREYFAEDIRDAEQQETARWHAEAARAARWHLFPARLPAAARQWGQCTATATAAVHAVGLDLAGIRSREPEQWRHIASVLGVPVPVALAWAIEGRIRQRLALLARPVRRALRTSVFQ